MQQKLPTIREKIMYSTRERRTTTLGGSDIRIGQSTRPWGEAGATGFPSKDDDNEFIIVGSSGELSLASRYLHAIFAFRVRMAKL